MVLALGEMGHSLVRKRIAGHPIIAVPSQSQIYVRRNLGRCRAHVGRRPIPGRLRRRAAEDLARIIAPEALIRSRG